MYNFYNSLSRRKKIIILLITIPLSIPAGAIIGLFIGLISTTFIPACYNDNGCHNCFEFNGLIGYEATGIIGFWIGLFLIPLFYISLIVYLQLKK